MWMLGREMPNMRLVDIWQLQGFAWKISYATLSYHCVLLCQPIFSFKQLSDTKPSGRWGNKQVDISIKLNYFTVLGLQFWTTYTKNSNYSYLRIGRSSGQTTKELLDFINHNAVDKGESQTVRWSPDVLHVRRWSTFMWSPDERNFNSAPFHTS